MATTPLQSVINEWNKRSAQAQSAGIPFAAYSQLAQRDIQHVIQTGGSGLTNEQAWTAIISAARNAPVIQDPKPKTGPLDIIGNVPSDLFHIVTGFIPGVVNLLHHLPSETQKTGEVISHAGQNVNNPGDLVRNLSQAPLLRLIPGVSTAGGLTTSEGRKELERHPVGTLLDVLPIAAGVGKLATASVVAEEGSAAEALQAGKVGKAGYRAIVPQVAKTKITEFARTYNIDLESVQKVFRPYSRQTSRNMIRLKQFAEKEIIPMWENIQPERRALIHDILTREEYNPMDERFTDVEHAGIQNVQRVMAAIKQEGLDQGFLVAVTIPEGIEGMEELAGKQFVFHNTSPVVKAAAKPEKNVVAISEDLVKLVDELNTKIGEAKAPPGSIRRVYLDRIKKLMDQKKKAEIFNAKRRTRIKEALLKTPPDDFLPRLEADALDNFRSYISQNFQATSIETALKDLESSRTSQDFKALVGEDAFNEIMESTVHSWIDLARNGYQPFFMHNTGPGSWDHMMSPKPLPDRIVPAKVYQKQIFNFGNSVHDIAFAATEAQADIIRNEGTQIFIKENIMPMAKTVRGARAEIEKRVEGSKEPIDPRTGYEGHVDVIMNREYVPFDPESYSAGFRKSFNLGKEEYVIPKHIHDALQRLMDEQRKLPAHGVWSKSMKVFKFSVLFGPRHLVHVGIGGLMFTAMREPGALTHIVEAAKAIKSGNIPADVLVDAYDLGGDQILATRVGKSHAQLFAESAGGVARGWAKFENFLSNIERAAIYLDKTGEGAGLSHDAALNTVNKTLISMEDMTPIERTIIKNVFPFYGFVKHLFRYLLTYPTDHPLRASILSRLAEQEHSDWTSGLPEMFQHLFYIGEPDSKGNILTVDYKSINPFRSFANDFTLAGFTSMLNPALSAVLQTMGINVLNASTPLHPDLAYDPNTGNLVAQRKNQGLVENLAQSYIPETGAIDHFFQFSDRMRNLKTSSPEAYRAELFSSLNLPFTTQKVNLPYTEAKAETHRYQAAQVAVTKAWQGDYSEIMRYNLVPFRGQLVPPQQLRALIEYLRKVSPQVNPKGIIPQR